jgi:hypothetical protein
MKPIIFDREFNKQNIKWLMDEISQHLHEHLIIYFSSWGSDISREKILVNYLNTLNLSNIQISIVAFDKLHGSGFTVFFKTGLKKSVLKTAFGIIRIPHDKKAMSDIRKENRFMYNTLKQENEEYLKWLRPLYFNKTEVRKINGGKDLVITNERLRFFLSEFDNLLIEPLK